MPAKFTYERLNHTRKEVRYLKVLPQHGAVIQCRLYNAPLEPGHISLSHRWTDKDGHREIFVNNKPFPVSTNVWNFLHIARQRYDAQERFWIDAICIDQQSIAEKNRQVPLMGEVYSSAKLVISWLGLCDSTTRMCIEAIQTQNLNLETNHFQHSVSETDIFWRDFWDHLVRFFQNDYWKRAWVVQEVLLATDGYLLVGDVQLSWSALIDFWNLVTRSKYAPQTHLQRLNDWNFGHEQQPRQAVKSGQLATLRSLLARYGKQTCDDYHDRVYSLLSLAKDRDRIKVDYRSSREQLFFDTLAACGVEKCFCFATCLMHSLKLHGSLMAGKGQKEFMAGAWQTFRLTTDADSEPIVSFGINIEDSLPLGPGVFYTTNQDDAQWLRSLPQTWKRTTGKSLRFLYTAVPAEFLINKSPLDSQWYCSAVRFHHGKAWTRHIETFHFNQDSGIYVHTMDGSNTPCCLRFTRSALLKLLLFGEQHTICHEPSLGGFEILGQDGKLRCGNPVARYSQNAVRRTSIPYRRCSIPATPRSTPSVGKFGSSESPNQLRHHAQALRQSLFQVKDEKLLSVPMAAR